MADRVMRWARWTRGDLIECQVPCEVTAAGEAVPPAGWVLIQTLTPAENMRPPRRRGSSHNRPQQPDIPGLL